MVLAVAEIYSERQFTVLEDGVESCPGQQRAGISQGCPLSPFLFGIVMTILMRDAYSRLGSAAKSAHDQSIFPQCCTQMTRC